LNRKQRKEENFGKRLFGKEVRTEEELEESIKKRRKYLLDTEFTEEELYNGIKLNETEIYIIINNMEIIARDIKISPEIFEKKELIKKYIEKNNNCGILKKTTSRLKSDEEFMLEMIKDYPEAIGYISNKLKKNKEFIEKAVEINKTAKDYIDF